MIYPLGIKWISAVNFTAIHSVVDETFQLEAVDLVTNRETCIAIHGAI